MSVDIVEKQISKTLRNSDLWMLFLWFWLIVLISAIIYCIYIGIKQNYFVVAVLIPLLGVVIKALSDQNKANIELISALNETQTITNDQDETLRRIKMEELADKERGG